MDIGNVIGEYSGTYNLSFKLKKMEIAKKNCLLKYPLKIKYSI